MGEEFNDDEIIDLEEIEDDSNSESLDSEPIVESTSKRNPKNYNLPKINRQKNEDTLNNKTNNFRNIGTNKSNVPNNSNNNGTIQKLNNIRNINRNIPPIGGINSSMGNEEKENSIKDTVEKKAGGMALTAATGGAIHGKVAEEAVGLMKKAGVLNSPLKKYYIIGVGIVLGMLFFLFIIIGSTSDSDLGKNTNAYIKGQSTDNAATNNSDTGMTDDELYDQLNYYGYCSNKENCKKKGIYKMFVKLKELSNDYSKACGSEIKNNEPCGINLNTGLIIETVNYYRNSSNHFDFLDNEETEESRSIFEKILGYFKRKEKMKNFLTEIEKLALAQSEYVNGGGRKYYQISFNKYISYLKYGETSTHPNYSGEPVTSDSSTPKNDYIATSYNQGDNSITSISGNGVGTEIVNYALKFVGNKYVYGGTSLENGIDCSGFTMKVMEHFGIKLPHSSKEQIKYGTDVGTSVDGALPGDIIIYQGHVAIYMGDNKIVHAANEKLGITVSNNASYSKILGIRRLWN